MKILVSCFTGVGNGLQMTPMFRSLSKAFPGCRIYLAGNNLTGVLDLLEDNPVVECLYRFPLKAGLVDNLAFLRWVNSMHFDAVIMPFISSPIWLSALVPFFKTLKVIQHIRAVNPNKADMVIRAAKSVSGRKVSLVPFVQGRSEVDLYLDLAEALAGFPIDRDPRTEICFEARDTSIERFGLPDKYVCIQPGAANGSRTPKKWPADSFVRLASLLRAKYSGIGVVAVGSVADYEVDVKRLEGRIPGMINTAGLTSLNELAAVISGAQAVICHDSGVMHIANAIGVPLIALYGPTDYTRTAPRGKNSRIIRKELSCAPCMCVSDASEQALAEKCPEPRCMTAITPEEVFRAVEDIISSPVKVK